MNRTFLIWWTNQNDCERIAPLASWPKYLYDEFRSRYGRNGRGRLWVSSELPDAPDGVDRWNEDENWLCKSASDAGGIVIPAEDIKHVQFLPGFVTTFEMTLPEATCPDVGQKSRPASGI